MDVLFVCQIGLKLLLAVGSTLRNSNDMELWLVRGFNSCSGQSLPVGVVNISRLDIELICVCVHPYKRSENLSTPRIGVTLTLVASVSVAKPAAGEKIGIFE